jgi:hypothetical protein
VALGHFLALPIPQSAFRVPHSSVGLAARCEWGPLAVRQVGSAEGGVAHASQRAAELGILAQVVIQQTERGAGMLP